MAGKSTDETKAVNTLDDANFQKSKPTSPSRLSQDESSLGQMPLEIQRKVLNLLLLSTKVRNVPAGLETPSYSFQPFIMAVNRAFEREARSILYPCNVFVVVSTNWEGIYHFLRTEGVPIVSKSKVAAFREHHLRVHVVFPMEKPDSLQVFLMVAEDLNRLCRFLRMDCLMVPLGGCYPNVKKTSRAVNGIRILLQLRETTSRKPDLAMQKLLLEPFKKVHGGMATSKISGKVNDAFRLEVLEKMMPRVHQIRAEGWSVFRLCREIKQEGDLAYKIGNLDRAAERYEWFLEFFAKCIEALPDITFQTDDGWEAVMDGLTFRNVLNLTRVYLAQKEFEKVLKYSKTELQELKERTWLKNSEKAAMFLHRGLAHAELGKVKSAMMALENAQVYSPNDLMIQSNLDTIRARSTEAKRGGRPLYKGISQSTFTESIVEEQGQEMAEKEFQMMKNFVEAMSDKIRKGGGLPF